MARRADWRLPCWRPSEGPPICNEAGRNDRRLETCGKEK